MPHSCSRRKPFIRLLIAWVVPFFVIRMVAGYLHLYKILWLKRPLVMGFSFLLICRVNLERSGKICIASYGLGRGALDLASVIIFSLMWKNWILMRMSLGTDAAR